MAWNLNNLVTDSDAGQTAFSRLYLQIVDFRDGRVAGITYTAAMKTAVKERALASLEEVERCVAAVRAQFDANS